MYFVNEAQAHGGGLDSSGGHNCYVGSCAGSYHYHRGIGSSSVENSDVFGWIFIVIILVCMIYPFVKNIPKVVIPELRTPAETRYWDAYEAKEKATQNYEQQLLATSKVGAEYSKENTTVTKEEWIEARNKLEDTEKCLSDAIREYDEALRLVHLDKEKRKQEKRNKRFK